MAGEYADFQELVDEVSALLGAPATLEDRDFGLIAFGVHDSDEAGATDPVRTRSILTRRSTAEVRAWFERYGIATAVGPVRIPAAPAAGVLRGRLCLPVRHAGVVHGYVWLLDEAEHSPAQLAAAMSVAERIGDRLAAAARAGSAAGEALRALLTAGSRAGRDEAEDALRSALGQDADEPHAMVCVRFPRGPRSPGARTGAGPAFATTSASASVSGTTSGSGPGPGPSAAAPAGADDGGARGWNGGGDLPGLRAVPGAAALVAVPERSGVNGGGSGRRESVAALVRLRAAGRLAPARTAAARLLDELRAPGAVAGVSQGCPSLARLPDAWREARDAARAACAEPGLGPVAIWSDLGAYRLLTALPAGAAPDPAVAPLLDPAHAELARTAEVYLDCAGQASRAAAALAVHRQTLYYRLSRIESLTGLDLSDGSARLLLHMALKAERL